MRLTIFDYGAGNLHSLAKALVMPGVELAIETNPSRAVEETDALILPGVGAFGLAAERLARGRDVMLAALQGGLPCLGICLGMQLLFDGSEEGAGTGIGLVPGRVRRLRAERVPQMGWNSLEGVRGEPLLARAGLDTVYYANGFVGEPLDSSVVTAWSTHEEDRFPAAVRIGSVVGVQFHPEKSSAPGVRFMHEFLKELL
ncbi:MAG: Imidazole glycerol phosphate synthase subunit hisH [Gemmatimonadetes bacterium]|nr:Imidazole glycerol phosphate synthase subunit hisH [Gemmatimonadota bacterium]